MSEAQLREQICVLAKSLFDRGFTVGSSGNISARTDEGNWLMTPTNSSFGFLDPEELSRFDSVGNHIDGKEPTKEMAAAYEKRRSLVYNLLKEIPGFEVNMPQGAFYFFPDVSTWFGKGPIKNASDFCLYILEEAKVSLVTGEAFGDPNCIRLSYAASEEELREAISRIKKALESIA